MLDPDDEQIIKESKESGAVLVTWDHVLRSAADGITPYEAFDHAIAEGRGNKKAQAEVSRLRGLSPAELTALADAGNKTFQHFRQHIEISRESAKLIRRLRVERDYSWRTVARFFSQAWCAPWGGNQLAGMVICEKAAKLLGEDFLQPPWN